MATRVPNRNPTNGISVLICGAGVGGIMAALECWRVGCEVRVVERSNGVVTSGDSFTIGVTAINAFTNWPQLQRTNEEIAYSPMIAYCNQSGEKLVGPMEFSALTSDISDVQRVYRHSRPKFHAMLHEQLSDIGLEVEYGMEVVDYFEDAGRGRGGVVFKDGSRREADVVVAADGVRTMSWSLVVGQPVPARPSGDAIFRASYPVEQAIADPAIAERFPLLEHGRSLIELWVGEGFVATFWRSEDEMQVTLQHPDHGTAAESWGQRVHPDQMLEWTATIPGWPEVADRVIKTIPQEALVDWKLMWRDPQPKSTSSGGRVVQLGDAAHTFLPSSGNGATQAIEDAVSLAACISMCGNNKSLPDAMHVHNLLRFERVSCLQAFGVVNRSKHSSGAKNGTDPKKNMVHVGRWMLEHDPNQYAKENYAAALDHLRSGTPFRNTNIPPGLQYKTWTIDSLLDAQGRGETTILDGDWD